MGRFVPVPTARDVLQSSRELLSAFHQLAGKACPRYFIVRALFSPRLLGGNRRGVENAVLAERSRGKEILRKTFLPFRLRCQRAEKSESAIESRNRRVFDVSDIHASKKDLAPLKKSES